jgi:hypothetical protein
MINQIVCICGKKKSGKDTLANSLLQMAGSNQSVKIFHFVDELKEASANLFNLDREKLYGTDDQKNEFTHYTWANWAKIFKSTPPSSNKFMTHREWMQYFGTEFCRTLDENMHVKNTLSKINKFFNNGISDNKMAIIADGRFQNEAEGAMAYGAIIIQLTRGQSLDAHASEALDLDPNCIDLLLDNKNMTIEEQAQVAYDFIQKQIKIRHSI